MRILLFDCKDSFTYNLAQLTRKLLGPEDSLEVVRNDKLRLSDAEGFDRILLSPGPGVPEETENLMPLIERYAESKPFLGVCLGHQALASAFGGRLINLRQVFHGIKSRITVLERDRLFAGLPPEIEGGRYHSWAAADEGFPPELTVAARSSDGLIMAFSHKTLEIHGVQFHPESILTPDGPMIVRNFLCGRRAAESGAEPRLLSVSA